MKIGNLLLWGGAGYVLYSLLGMANATTNTPPATNGAPVPQPTMPAPPTPRSPRAPRAPAQDKRMCYAKGSKKLTVWMNGRYVEWYNRTDGHWGMKSNTGELIIVPTEFYAYKAMRIGRGTAHKKGTFKWNGKEYAFTLLEWKDGTRPDYKPNTGIKWC